MMAATYAAVLSMDCHITIHFWCRLTSSFACMLCRWGLPVSVVSLIWLVFAAVIFTFPTRYPITGENCNYAAAVVGGVSVGVTIAWVLSARFWFTGPRVDVDNSDAVKTKYWVTDPPRKVHGTAGR